MGNYSDASFVNFSKLEEPPEIEIDIQPDVDWAIQGLQSIFTQFSWLEVVQALGVFLILFLVFYNQKILNMTNAQTTMITSFVSFFFVLGMLYANFYTSFVMLGFFFLLWLGSVIMTIRDT
jgi:phosphoglycerol transferase MdoB-like AlkP superfamily enzyme